VKRFLIPLLAALALPVQAQVDPEVRKACLAAADFEGCVRAYAQPAEKKQQLDFLGMELIPGWEVYEDRANNFVMYFDDKNVRKVKVRGVYGRYITFDYVTRYFQEYIPGTSGYSTTIGSGTTNCYGSGFGSGYGYGYGSGFGYNSGYNSSANCITTPPATINIPGTSATPSGVRQYKTKIIIDCLERKAKDIFITKGYSKNRKWKSIEGKGITQPIADLNCSKIQSLEASNYLKLEKGKPKEQDILAQQILPGSNPQEIIEMVSKLKRKGVNCDSPVWKNKPRCN
jgi:hypothetical protein